MLAEATGGDLSNVFLANDESTRKLIADIFVEIGAFVDNLPPEQQCQLGERIAEAHDFVTGQPAAFVTFTNFSSELMGVAEACEYLDRSRSAVTTYVQEGLLPAIRLGEKQYLFFRKHLERFSPPKKGPRFKPDDI